ncbi:MAG: glycosyltransferase family 2 protein [Bryobacterales bacterium]|nr:glycosyltransferase family 2 protein [Bryobacterales bacterium]
MHTDTPHRRQYVLVTAAYNEEAYIPYLINSIIAQTHRPLCWVIVSDGSTDRTDQIVTSYASRHAFIQLHRILHVHPRNFAAQVHAINAGFDRLQHLEFDYIGNVDADITLEPTYFADLLAKFELDPNLGLAGGYIAEWDDGAFKFRGTNAVSSVAHAIQLFRRTCLRQLGGAYMPLPYGGPDWYAEVAARQHGWKVQAFTDLKVCHHRPTGAAAGSLRTSYREGLMDHSLGSHPCFEIFRILRRLQQRPFLLSALIRLWAFLMASLRRADRPVSNEFVQFLRQYELERLKRFFGFAWTREQ